MDIAIARGDARMLETLRELGAAVLGRELAIVGLLVRGGCDVNGPTVARRSTRNKGSPLGIALWVRSRNPRDGDAEQIVQILRAAGAQE